MFNRKPKERGNPYRKLNYHLLENHGGLRADPDPLSALMMEGSGSDDLEPSVSHVESEKPSSSPPPPPPQQETTAPPPPPDTAASSPTSAAALENVPDLQKIEEKQELGPEEIAAWVAKYKANEDRAKSLQTKSFANQPPEKKTKRKVVSAEEANVPVKAKKNRKETSSNTQFLTFK